MLANGLLIFSFYSSNQFLAHALSRPGEPMRYDFSSLCGFLTILCFFLHTRIFDDHKDYAADSRFFPDRVLQRGVVTLGELKFLAALAIVLEFACAIVCGPAALVALSVAFAFSLLMLKEFFVADWLKKRFLLYASVHMLIMPLLAMTVWSFATKQYFWEIPLWYWLYSMVSFFLAFNWEVSRKIRVPEEEIEGVDSYTRLFGTYGAAYLVLLIRVIDTGLVTLVALHLGSERAGFTRCWCCCSWSAWSASFSIASKPHQRPPIAWKSTRASISSPSIWPWRSSSAGRSEFNSADRCDVLAIDL